MSEGQFKEVKRVEIAAVLHACGQLPGEGGQPYRPKLTFIVAQKRHHTRLFPRPPHLYKKDNPLPGTVVDTLNVRPNEFTFFLNSHAGEHRFLLPGQGLGANPGGSGMI